MGYSELLLLFLSFMPLFARAQGRVSYNASYPLRPTNLTTLTWPYGWVGSYYNATAQIELIPLIGPFYNVSLCDALQGQTFTKEYSSRLSISPRASYNVGENPVNAFLNFWETDYNFSSLPRLATLAPITRTSEWWLDSSPEVLWQSPTLDNTTFSFESDEPYYDIFNLTLESTTNQQYTLTGNITTDDTTRSPADFNLFWKSCNTSIATNQYLVSLIRRPTHWTDRWTKWTYPTINLEFDNKTANYTLDGYFTAIPNISPNNTYGAQVFDTAIVQGRIKVTFAGVIDPYYSDIMVIDGITPSWLRTVGFNNNSQNFGFTMTSSASRDLSRPLSWRNALAILCALAIL